MTTPTAPTLPEKSAGSEEVAGDSLLQLLAQTYHEVVTSFERFMGMSRARWAILNRLSRVESMTQAALAQRLRVDAAAVTRQVKQLEAEGMVTRWSYPEDNRFTVVALTEHGRHSVEQLRSEREAFEQIATTGLTLEEIDHMRRCLAHMRHNLERFSQEG